MNRITRNLILLNVLVLSFFPSILCSHLGMSDSFCYTTIGFLENSKSDARIFPIQEESNFYKEFEGIEKRPLMEILLFILHEVTDISFIKLQFLPLGGFILPIMYLALIKDVLKVEYLALSAVIYFGFVIASPTSYSVYIHSWAFSIYILFLILYRKQFLTLKPELSLLLIVVLIASNFYYYTTTVWIICLVLANYLLSVCYNFKKRMHLLVFSIVIFFLFNRIFYDTFLPKLVKTETFPLIDSLSMLLLRIKNLGLTDNSLQDELLFFGPPNQDALISKIALLILIVITAPIIYIIIDNVIHLSNLSLSLKNLLKQSGDSNFLFGMAILFTAIFDIAAYSVYGVIIFRYIHFFMPIVSLICLKPFKKLSYFFIYFLIILQFLILIMNSSAGDDFVRSTTYSELTPSSLWLSEKIQTGSRILIDFDNSGKYFVLGTMNSFFFKRIYYNIDLYKGIISYSNRFSINKFIDFVIIDVKSNGARIKSVGWISFRPFKYYTENINTNNNLDKIYNDNISWIFKPAILQC